MEAAQREEGRAVSAQRTAREIAPSGPTPERRLRRTWSSVPERQVDFPLVRNGLDYLDSVVRHLDENESGDVGRDVKYAVLHLQAAVEVLFKARLFAEHWTLVFDDPQHATLKKLDSVDFKSVTTEAAIIRLRNVVDARITDKDQAALKKLRKDRNALQHFGLTHDARAIEARAAVVLDFLIRFCDEQLLPCLTDKQEKSEAEAGLRRLRDGLNRIESFVRERMNRIRGELKREGAENRTIECPDCEQMALVLRQSPAGTTPDDQADLATCRHCSRVWDTEELLGHFNEHGQEEPTEWNTCPQCKRWSLGSEVRVCTNPEQPIFFCFSCVIGFPAVVPCVQCARPVDASGLTGPVLCDLCEMHLEDEQRYGPSYESPGDYGYEGEE
ncbi:serine/arginine repetitive matrix protein 1 [Streptomyces sp. NPDC057496]|uniref:serine/arginine repetitive matrix protein 1 n=1 Tax=Streptomyces sp. NPDC057496 TaxID=3346149 RepID=UPI0036A7A9D8